MSKFAHTSTFSLFSLWFNVHAFMGLNIIFLSLRVMQQIAFHLLSFDHDVSPAQRASETGTCSFLSPGPQANKLVMLVTRMVKVLSWF